MGHSRNGEHGLPQFFVNYELNLVTRNIDLCYELQKQFLYDLSEAEEVSFSKWVNRPWTSI